ncbi:MAG TPA: AAA family ATPase [Candidatus Limnocylindrales bacterium]
MEPVGPLVCPVLVGRDDLIALADRRLDEARGRRGELLFLAGEAGIGKTRLLDEIERSARDRGFRVLHAATFARDLEVAAGPFLDLAHAMKRDRQLADAGQRLLDRLEDTNPDDPDAHRRRRLLVLDVVHLLAGLATEPLLIAIEDLHWADDLSLELLAALASRLREQPAIVVGTYRSDELYPRVPMREWRARLLTQRIAEEARLNRLSVEETGRMTRAILALDEPISGDLVGAVHDRTDGIPLHVEELLGALPPGAAAADRIRAADVPETLQEAILRRVSERSRAARTVAETGAVIGRSFDPGLLARVIDRPEERLEDPLRELVRYFFLVPTSGGQYDFRHATIRDTIYGQIPVRRRRDLHLRVARAATALGGMAPAVLSAHFEQAGEAAEAYRTALAGGRAAGAISSHREAFDLLGRATRNLPAATPTIERASVFEELGVEAAAVDDAEAAQEAFESARQLYHQAGATVEAAAVIPGLATAGHAMGQLLEQRAHLLRSGLAELDTVPDRDVRRVRARLLAGLALAYCLDFRIEESIEYAERAGALAAEVGDLETELHVLATRGLDLVFTRRMDDGWQALEEVVSRGRAAGLEAEVARAYDDIGSSAWELIEYERSERWLRDGIGYAERVERWDWHHAMAGALAVVMWATGRWDEATRIAERAFADGRGGRPARITCLWVMGYVAMGQGEFERARALLGSSARSAQETGELLRWSPPVWGLAETALLSGNPAEAIDLGRRAAAAYRTTEDTALFAPYAVTGTRALLTLSDPVAAASWVEEAERILAARSRPGPMIAVDHSRGLLLRAQGRLGLARQRLETARAAWMARGRVWEATWSLIDLAECQLRANRPSEAGTLLEEAIETTSRLGCLPLRDRAEHLLRSVRSRRPSSEPWRPLTVREFEVARLIAAGLTNAQIADELSIAPKTASAHIEHILAKLGAARRSEIAAWAAGITGASDPPVRSPAAQIR